MPANPLLALCKELDAEGLRALDRETLLAVKKELKAHKREVDRALLRLSFAEEEQLN